MLELTAWRISTGNDCSRLNLTSKLNYFLKEKSAPLKDKHRGCVVSGPEYTTGDSLTISCGNCLD